MESDALDNAVGVQTERLAHEAVPSPLLPFQRPVNTIVQENPITGGTVTHTGALVAGQLVIGNGAADIQITTTGTSVLTALGISVGSVGAFVVNGGALGTPSSGVATNLTGTASGLTAGLATDTVSKTGTGSTYATGTAPTITNPVIANIAPGADFTVSQNSVAPLTSVNSGAVVNTLVLKAGFVGIGTATPSEREGFGPTSFLQIGDGAGGQVGLAMNKSNGQTANLITQGGLYIDVFGDSTATNNVIHFRTEETNSAITPTERMRIDSAGNVGINVVPSASKFAIVGLPTSAAGLATGDIWVDTAGGLNILKIV